MRTLSFLLAAITVTGCVDAEESVAPTAPNLLASDGKADSNAPLWAGLTSITIERYVADPCNEGRNALGGDPYVYGDWARQRAGIRNICFEVWSPGVTDWDNPDFWQQLDVQVHYRYGTTGPFRDAYVDSNGRRGNNRRYAFALGYELDPTVYVAGLTQLKSPFRILSESNGYALVEADMEVYFTVNGRKLEPEANHPYVIRYQGYVRSQPPLAASATGYVLHDIVTCEQGAVRFGSGAGFFAADISHAAAASLTTGLDGSLIYGIGITQTGNLLSMIYPTQTSVPGQALPGFGDAAGLRITPNGASMTVELDVYDRALAATRQLSATFHGCATGATN